LELDRYLRGGAGAARKRDPGLENSF